MSFFSTIITQNSFYFPFCKLSLQTDVYSWQTLVPILSTYKTFLLRCMRQMTCCVVIDARRV